MRLDVYLVETGRVESRTRASHLIKMGGVCVDGRPITKPSYEVGEGATVEVTDLIGYASLGGLKLKQAIDKFSLSVCGRCVDIGASNGGFTHCLLSHGANEVYAVDVGECALPDYLRQDERVRVLDRTNARDLTPDMVGGLADIVVADVSFISITYLLPTIASILSPDGYAVVLVKPQFEVGPKALGKSGVVRDPKLRSAAVDKVISCAAACGLIRRGLCEVPLIFEDKNVEYLLLLRPKKV